MAFEVKDWKKEGCSLSIPVSKITNRETFSREINEKYGEGGGLNANYQQVEAVAIISNILGTLDIHYGFHFIFKTCGDEISFDFNDTTIKKSVENIFNLHFKDKKLL